MSNRHLYWLVTSEMHHLHQTPMFARFMSKAWKILAMRFRCFAELWFAMATTKAYSKDFHSTSVSSLVVATGLSAYSNYSFEPGLKHCSAKR